VALNIRPTTMDKIVEILSPWMIKQRNQAVNAYIGYNVSKVETPEEIAAEIRTEIEKDNVIVKKPVFDMLIKQANK